MNKLLIVLLIASFFYSCEKASDAAIYGGGQNGTGGSMARFTLMGNYLYTVDDQNLKVYDVSNPSSPQFKKSVFIGFEIETIYPFKDKLFIGSTSVVHIFNVEDPLNPQKLSQAISPNVVRRCDPVVAKDTVAYATLRANSPCGGTGSILAVYDIKNITNPVQKSFLPLGEPYGLGYSGTTLYVCDNEQGLLVFDITEAYQPKFTKSINDGSYIDVIPLNDLLICWVSNGMILYDITNKQSPVLLTRIN